MKFKHEISIPTWHKKASYSLCSYLHIAIVLFWHVTSYDQEKTLCDDYRNLLINTYNVITTRISHDHEKILQAQLIFS